MAKIDNNCIYKTISLQDGEVFVVPPGAELLYVSDTNAVVSSCDQEIPDVSSTCYRFEVPMSGTDIDDPIEFFITQILFDDLGLIINPAFGYGLGSLITSNAETPQGYVDRLADNLWGQLTLMTNNIVLGLRIVYQNLNVSGDIVQIMLNIPDIFTEVKIRVVDSNNTNNNPEYFLEGLKVECDDYIPFPTTVAVRGTI